MAESTIPGDGDTLEAGWRALFPRSGVTNDFTGTGLRVTATGASQAVSVSVGTALVEGFLYENDATKAFNLGALGTQPTGSQERYTRIVVRLDTSSTPYTAEAVAVTGSPAASGAATVPALVRTSSAYDLPLATVRQTTASISQSAVADEREWWGEHHEVSPGASVAGPIGSSRGRGNQVFHHVYQGGSPAVLASARGDLPEVQIPGSSAQWAVTGSFVEARGGNVTVQLDARRVSSPITSATNLNTVCVLPEAYRPTRLRRAPFFVIGSPRTERPAEVRFETDGGVILVGAIGVDGRVQGSITWPQR